MSKKYILLLTGMTCITVPSFARDNNHSGFYVTGKVGASVLQQKNQRYTERSLSTDNSPLNNNPYNDYSFSGRSHTNARLGGGVAIGYNFDTKFNVPIRIDFDFNARMRSNSRYSYTPIPSYNDSTNNKVQLNTFIFNASYDFKNNTRFTPYISAGVGLASINNKASNHFIFTSSSSDLYSFQSKKSHTSNNFAWNAGAGVKYKINEDFSLDFSYKYLGAGKSNVYLEKGAYNTFQRSKTKIYTQDIMLGLTYNF